LVVNLLTLQPLGFRARCVRPVIHILAEAGVYSRRSSSHQTNWIDIQQQRRLAAFFSELRIEHARRTKRKFNRVESRGIFVQQVPEIASRNRFPESLP
jgi:hypothetical protein